MGHNHLPLKIILDNNYNTNFRADLSRLGAQSSTVMGQDERFVAGLLDRLYWLPYT
jgi:hypothetical protein